MVTEGGLGPHTVIDNEGGRLGYKERPCNVRRAVTASALLVPLSQGQGSVGRETVDEWAFAGVLWSLITPARWLALGWLGCGLAVLGTLLLTASPFLDGATPLLNNYIPVLDQRVFMAGLLACGAGFGIAILRTLLLARAGPEWAGGERALRQGVLWAAIAGALAWLALGWTWFHLPAAQGAAYFEMLFSPSAIAIRILFNFP